jgi:tight adherence protein B
MGKMEPITFFFIIGGGIALVMLLIGVYITTSEGRGLVDKRLKNYLENETKSNQRSDAKHMLSDWVNRRVEKSSFGERIARELARADLKFKPGEYIALYVISIVGLAMITYLIGGRILLSAIIGGIIGSFLPRMYLKSQQAKRLHKFNDQLPDMLNLVVNGLRAGFSTLQAMEAVSKELPPPICDEFKRVVQEMQLGVTMEKALSNLLRRIPSEDLDFVVTSINIQREVGGNLAEIMEIISFTIRERIRIKGEIRVLTSQVKYSGRILSLMPVILVLVLYFLNRPYIMDLFLPENVLCGSIAIGLAVLLIIIGYFVMNKFAQIEV